MSDEAEIQIEADDEGCELDLELDAVGPIERTLHLAAAFIEKEGPGSGRGYIHDPEHVFTPFDEHAAAAVKAARDDTLVAAYDLLTRAFRAVAIEAEQ